MKGATKPHRAVVVDRSCFNSRSREGSDLTNLESLGDVDSFNSRSREGSDFIIPEIVSYEVTVSIHAPVKGATERRKS